MTRADRELLADLARLTSDVVPLAMRLMDDTATVEEQQTFADRLTELGTRLSHRAHHAIVIDTAQEPHRVRTARTRSGVDL